MSVATIAWDKKIPARFDPSVLRLRGETIVCFGWTDWDTNQQTWNQVLRRLAFRNRVIYVPPPFERTEVLGSRFSGKHRPDGMNHLKDHLYVYQFPRWQPRLYRPAAIAGAMESMRFRGLRRALRKIGGTSPILYLLHPRMGDSVGRLGEKMVIYHVLDEYSGYRGANREKLGIEENALLDQADLVLCASELLERSKRKEGRNVHFVPNGVDFDHFSRIPGIGTREPFDLSGIPHPRAGYLGRICDKLDFPLLKEVAESLPKCAFCFVGPSYVAFGPHRKTYEEWAALPNVHLIGNKRMADVPNYLNAFDVALLPYLVSEDTKQRYPLKLHEYLAAGKPVVSVPLPCLDEFELLVRVATDSAAWRDAIAASLEEASDSDREERMSVARRHDWNRVVLRIEGLISETIRRKAT